MGCNSKHKNLNITILLKISTRKPRKFLAFSTRKQVRQNKKFYCCYIKVCLLLEPVYGCGCGGAAAAAGRGPEQPGPPHPEAARQAARLLRCSPAEPAKQGAGEDQTGKIATLWLVFTDELDSLLSIHMHHRDAVMSKYCIKN